MSNAVAKYQKYAEYQDSGVEWLGEIPSHWEVKKFVYVIEAVGDIDHYMPDSVDSGIPYIMTGDLQNLVSQIDLNSCKQVSKEAYKRLSKKIKTTRDDIILARYATIGTVSYVDIDAEFLVSYSCVTIKPNLIKTTGKYLFSYLKSDAFLQAIQMQINSNTQGNVGVDNLRSVKFIIPPLSEQSLIIDFLDHETAKIDTLIAKQEKLIELLKEKRQAVISHAVTKGLNPNVPMKDSGVEWLGEVPEHWVSARLKYYTNQIVDGAHSTPTYTESGVPFLRVTDIHNSKIDMDNIKYIPKHEHLDLIQRCKPENGDLLLSKNGTIGIPKLVDWDWEFSIFVSLCLIKFKKNLKAEFAEYFFKSYEIQEQIFGLIKKSTVINLHLDKIENFWFSIPPLEEQIQIVGYLDNKINELNNLISKAESAIQLMQERRTALISSAVTGKIDVRHWQNPDKNNHADMELSA